MPRTAIDYSKTIIYKIVCNDLNVKDKCHNPLHLEKHNINQFQLIFYG